MTAKDKLIETILTAPEEFANEIAKGEHIDLTEVSFKEVNLSGLTFNNADFNSSSFSDSYLCEIKFIDCDLTSVDFTRSSIIECSFENSILNGTDFSYSVLEYCDFTEADMSGCIFEETNLKNSDLSASYNLNASRFDAETIWPDADLLPDDFDGAYSDDPSLLKDDEDDYSTEQY